MKNILYTLLLALVVVGCDDRLDDLNTDKKNPASVDPQSLFANATREIVDNMVSMSVNDNPFRLYSQQWAQTTYPDESQYNMTTREIPYNFFVNQYRDVLVNLNESKMLIQTQLDEGTSSASDATLANRMAIIDVLMGYTYITLVDAFGNVPYSQALNPDEYSFPAYDDARTIYDGVDATLATASATLANGEGDGFDADLVYGGDAEAWGVFANSLRLRMAMRLADVDAATSVSRANAAMAAGVISSNADNFSMAYQSTSPNSSPLHEDLVLSGRADFVAANTLVDYMNSLDDPRRAVYFRQNLGDGVYSGGIYGTANSYSGSTQVGDILHQPETPGVLMNYAEMHFLMAEMAERGGYNVTGSAADHFNAGVEASFDQWEVDGGAAFAASLGYAGGSTWKQEIGTQMWVALYNQGFEAWNSWKRLDFTGFNAPPGMTLSDIPVRLLYPDREATLNGDALAAAQSAIGGDEMTTRVFWDAN